MKRREPQTLRWFFPLSVTIASQAVGQWTPLPTAEDPLIRMPGTQPHQVTLESSTQCLNCHGGFDPDTEPGFAWKGSMMGQAARDFLFWSCLTVAAQDSIWAIDRPNATDLCLRCHLPKGWLEGRSDPTNGSLMVDEDFDGVQCTFCHSAWDPFFEDTWLGAREGSDWLDYWDETNLSTTPSQPAADATRAADGAEALAISLFDGDPFFLGNRPVSPAWNEHAAGQYFVAGGREKRGSFADAGAKHPILYSRHHKSAYFCSACHDVSNPVLLNLPYDGTPPGDGVTVLPSEQVPASSYFHLERTFSEFQLSDFGRPGGAPGRGPFAPGRIHTQLPGDWISKCQDCHMPDRAGAACDKGSGVQRPAGSVEHPGSGVPHHGFVGGNALVPWVLASTVPGSPNWDPVNAQLLRQGAAVLTLDLDAGVGLDPGALLDQAERARSMLAKAAALRATFDRAEAVLRVQIRNRTAHKLISGFPEGRRMFLGVVASRGGTTVFEVNPYDATAGTLKGLPGSAGSPPLAPQERFVDELVFETQLASTLTGEQKTFHFALATSRYKDNRIPPRGFRIAEAAARLVEPVWHGASAPDWFTADEYDRGQHDVEIAIPVPCDTLVVSLWYQSTSREYVDFLRREIDGTGGTLPPEAYVVQTDPFFDRLRAWGDTLWQVWQHNQGVPGAAPILMARRTLQVDADGVTAHTGK